MPSSKSLNQPPIQDLYLQGAGGRGCSGARALAVCVRGGGAGGWTERGAGGREGEEEGEEEEGGAPAAQHLVRVGECHAGEAVLDFVQTAGRGVRVRQQPAHEVLRA